MADVEIIELATPESISSAIDRLYGELPPVYNTRISPWSGGWQDSQRERNTCMNEASWNQR